MHTYIHILLSVYTISLSEGSQKAPVISQISHNSVKNVRLDAGLCPRSGNQAGPRPEQEIRCVQACDQHVSVHVVL